MGRSLQKVDAKKLEKAELKLQQKQEKRMELAVNFKTAPPVRMESATASQVCASHCCIVPRESKIYFLFPRIIFCNNFAFF